ncbi:MAG: flagellar motor switch protein FliN [Phycisphaerales bacterium]|nr:flagellar motor switch protein FliN [Phycisphaerales bacterium]
MSEPENTAAIPPPDETPTPRSAPEPVSEVAPSGDREPEGAAAHAGASRTPTVPQASSLPARPFDPPTLEVAGGTRPESPLDFLDDVELDVRVELGRAEMLIEDVLKLSAGAVVELDKVAGDPVDIYVNARLVARGEVLVLNDTFCVRVNEIVSPIPESESAR